MEKFESCSLHWRSIDAPNGLLGDTSLYRTIVHEWKGAAQKIVPLRRSESPLEMGDYEALISTRPVLRKIDAIGICGEEGSIILSSRSR